jgi:hypothetical protein
MQKKINFLDHKIEEDKIYLQDHIANFFYNFPMS